VGGERGDIAAGINIYGVFGRSLAKYCSGRSCWELTLVVILKQNRGEDRFMECVHKGGR
jgi:hypothetical protein